MASNSSVRLGVVGARTIYATPTGVKVGTKGRVMSPRAFVSALPKGDARKIRKAARQAGYVHVATAERIPGGCGRIL